MNETNFCKETLNYNLFLLLLGSLCVSDTWVYFTYSKISEESLSYRKILSGEFGWKISISVQ